MCKIVMLMTDIEINIHKLKFVDSENQNSNMISDYRGCISNIYI